MFKELLQMGRKTELQRQIEQYCAWKAVRHPQVAKSHKDVLFSFARWSSMHCATTINCEILQAYLDTFSSQYFRAEARHALKQFCRYWYKMDLLTEDFARCIKRDLICDMESIVSPRLHIEQVKRVKSLRNRVVKGRPMSYRAIQLHMESEDGRKYDLKQLHQWANYHLPPGS